MPIVKVIEVIASSEKGIDDAIQNALAETSRTIKNIDSIFVKDIKVHVKDNRITSYGLICKVSFRIDDQIREQHSAH
ncbi:dodecin family protein [Longitalea luteola]|uniref:dodecin family protein n=1 Tax=Longitalea luteola TaxID=2812563 RepID=UPI001A97AF25|nr:dodecin family protein [Longitalea luteola]